MKFESKFLCRKLFFICKYGDSTFNTLYPTNVISTAGYDFLLNITTKNWNACIFLNEKSVSLYANTVFRKLQ